MDDDTSIPRRALLQSAAALALANVGSSAAARAADARGAVHAPAGGQPGDFAFLNGRWRIANRRLKAPGEWDLFEGESTCWGVLDGKGSIEELRIPARKFSGMGIRLLDQNTRLWNDFWVSGRDCVLATPGQTGGFSGGVGTFTADDVEDGKPIRVRGVWDRITATSCRWYQGVSRDGGLHFEDNWFMDWTRIA
jgi:hypothetical protein